MNADQSETRVEQVGVRLSDATLRAAARQQAAIDGLPNPYPTKRGCVIAAFPATGKSHYAAAPGRVDSDSSTFSRGPEWPANYIDHIRTALSWGETVLVSTHAEVRAALYEADIPYTLVYPSPPLREEYRTRMEGRGSPAALVVKVVDDLWDDALLDCAEQVGCVHIVLRAGEYLADVFEGGK